MFKGCANLSYVDLSKLNSFNYEGIFLGCVSLSINKKIESNSTQINLKDIIKDSLDILIVNCQTGEGGMCKTCQEGLIMSRYCEECNDGYYIPLQQRRSECLKCNSNCKTCIGTSTMSYCTECDEGYYAYTGSCIKKCNIGEDEKCKSCDFSFQEYCLGCNDGYFLPKGGYHTQCKKCDIKDCLKCKGSLTSYQCQTCDNGLIPSGNLCLPKCEIGTDNKCATCNDKPGKINQCLECNEGYYLPEDDMYNKTQCEKCSIDGCISCSGNGTFNKCLNCSAGLYPKFGNGEIISCDESSIGRIDIIKDGVLMDGIIEITQDYVVKTQVTNGRKYYTSGTCIKPSTSGWWGGLSGSTCSIYVAFNLSNILPTNKLIDDYILVLQGTERFTGTSNSYFNEFSISPSFFIECCALCEWSTTSLGYCSNNFGVYKNLERVNHNGRIFVGGVYTRGSDFYQLEGFNVTSTAGKGAQVVGGWNFGVSAGDYGRVTASLTITFIINNLYLVKKEN
jgi:hypothetical protein